MILTTLILLSSLAPAQDEPLTKAARASFRELFTEACAEQDPKARARLLRGAEKFSEYRFAELIAALRAGPLYAEDALQPREVAGELEVLKKFGTTTVGYAFECEAGRFRYALDLPRKYDPARAWPLLFDPGHGSAKDGEDAGRAGMLEMYRRHAREARLDDWIVARTEIIEQVGTGGARGALPEDQVAAIFQAFLRELSTRVHIDLDRVYVTGVSQTGYWSWYLGRACADRLAGIAPMSAITRMQADSYLTNFLNLPVYVLHGSDDTVTGVTEVRATCARLDALGFESLYREFEGFGHEYGVWKHQPEALAWLAERPRDPYPKQVSKSLQTLENPWCHWLRVDELRRTGDGQDSTAPTAGLDARIEGQTVLIGTDGIEGLTLFLAAELLDLDRPVEVIWNGRTVHEGLLMRDVEILISTAADKADWLAAYEIGLRLRP